MATTTFLSSLMTVVSFVTFLGIVAWAYSKKRKRAFDDAANAPFALPDDVGGVAARVNSGERQS
mgnify:CR=1 FL=1